jgi:3-oxoacyl-[acyl-carrier protein] reductase
MFPAAAARACDFAVTSQALSGKTALVTGAGRNIGRAIALRLAREGAAIAIHCKTSLIEAAALAREIEAEGGSSFILAADLATSRGIDSLARSLNEELARRGASGLDILVNNAAVISEGGDTIAATKEDDFDRIFAINLKAAFFLTQCLAPLLSDGGRVINLSSRPSTVAFPQGIVYAMTKAALNSLTASLAKQLGPRGITVNAIGPGVIETDRTVPRMLSTAEARAAIAATTALKRVGTGEDVADTVSFLASDAARWVTGAYIEVAGGAGI